MGPWGVHLVRRFALLIGKLPLCLSCTLNHREELGTVNQLNVAPLRELFGILGEASRCGNEASRRPLGRHDAIQFAHSGHSHLVCLPLFALHEELLAAFGKHQINATIWPVAP